MATPLQKSKAHLQNAAEQRQHETVNTQPMLDLEAIHQAPGRGAAISAIGRLYQQADRCGATVELSGDDEFEIKQLTVALGLILASSESAVVVPVVPFGKGGKFHPDNLELIEDPDPAELAARRQASAPAYKVGQVVMAADRTGVKGRRTVTGVLWDSHERDWIYETTLVTDSKGNVDYGSQQVFSNDEIALALMS